MMRTSVVMVICVFAVCVSKAQETIPLYKNKIPNSRPVPDEAYWNSAHTVVFKVSHPTLSVYLPAKGKANGTAVIICPGGGYHALVINREGFDIAERFAKMGVAAFVLKYRLPNDRIMVDKSIGPLQDAQQAIKVVRNNASKWHVDPHKVGIMGFSAGGHLASTAGTHFDSVFISDSEGVSLRPDFMILVYPVISMTDRIGHSGSRNNLLGKQPSKKEINYFSNEKQVNKETPPTFITQASDDSTVSVENSIVFYEALERNSVPVAMHIYEKGGHGYLHRPSRALWMNEVEYWMKTNGWLK